MITQNCMSPHLQLYIMHTIVQLQSSMSIHLQPHSFLHLQPQTTAHLQSMSSLVHTYSPTPQELKPNMYSNSPSFQYHPFLWDWTGYCPRASLRWVQLECDVALNRRPEILKGTMFLCVYISFGCAPPKYSRHDELPDDCYCPSKESCT